LHASSESVDQLSVNQSRARAESVSHMIDVDMQHVCLSVCLSIHSTHAQIDCDCFINPPRYPMKNFFLDTCRSGRHRNSYSPDVVLNVPSCIHLSLRVNRGPISCSRVRSPFLSNSYL